MAEQLLLSPSDDRLIQSKNSSAIPIDLIIDIFSRLPAKSIARFSCVSKLWASILRRQDFTQLFLKRSSSRPQILFACQQHGDLVFFSLPQSQINSSTEVASVNKLTHFTFGTDSEIYGLLNGFVCLIYKWISNGRKETAQMLCNPSTGQAYPLPKLPSKMKTKSLFGYDPIGKQFKVLSMISLSYGSDDDVMYDEHHVLTLGDGNMSWRKIECNTPHCYYRHTQICINGVVYYPSVNSSSDTRLLVCFDVRSEKFRFIKVKEALREALVDGTLVDYNGRFGLLLTDVPSSSFKLWVLEDLEKQEWSEHIFVFPVEWANIIRLAVLSFVGVTRENELVFSSYCPIYPFYLFYFNLQTKSIVRVEIQGMDVAKYNVLHPFINHVEDVMLM